jgi:hypothetical protein
MGPQSKWGVQRADMSSRTRPRAPSGWMRRSAGQWALEGRHCGIPDDSGGTWPVCAECRMHERRAMPDCRGRGPAPSGVPRLRAPATRKLPAPVDEAARSCVSAPVVGGASGKGDRGREKQAIGPLPVSPPLQGSRVGRASWFALVRTAHDAQVEGVRTAACRWVGGDQGPWGQLPPSRSPGSRHQSCSAGVKRRGGTW